MLVVMIPVLINFFFVNASSCAVVNKFFIFTLVLAQILPAEYRRQPFGSYKFDKILPQKKKLTEIQKIRKR